MNEKKPASDIPYVLESPDNFVTLYLKRYYTVK
jgi:hypothetical protein